MSVSSDEATTTEQDAEDKLQLEVAAGTPVLLNYLLTHPITYVLIDKKMSVSSDEATTTEQDAEDKLQLEVAAGTPVLLNYLLTHPITCSIQ
ncbi:hypothetical protein PYW07_011856 [Mythimna separata]|uniref:Uncharacterized protein n=1 Tax=Mythimna separata TaxID=271217 RepID=A0AAD7Y733_MYTSE|nr:hypothetical protein PYW07_011856 [Mythimna separata]